MWSWLASFETHKHTASDGPARVAPVIKLKPLEQIHGVQKKSCTLPEDKWFRQLLRHHNVQTTIAAADAATSTLACLVRVDAGKLFNDLVALDREEHVLRNFWGESGDVCSFRIREVWLVVWEMSSGDPVMFWQRNKVNGVTTRISPKQGWAFPDIHVADIVVHRLGSPGLQRYVTDLVQSPVPMLYVPQEIASLIMRGDWHTLIVLARWFQKHSRREGHGRDECPFVWPRAEDCRNLIEYGRECERRDPSSVVMNCAMLKMWASRLRAWAPRNLSNGEEVVGDQDILKTTIRDIELAALSMDEGIVVFLSVMHNISCYTRCGSHSTYGTERT